LEWKQGSFLESLRQVTDQVGKGRDERGAKGERIEKYDWSSYEKKRGISPWHWLANKKMESEGREREGRNKGKRGMTEMEGRRERKRVKEKKKGGGGGQEWKKQRRYRNAGKEGR
jgi:hypothetical protein